MNKSRWIMGVVAGLMFAVGARAEDTIWKFQMAPTNGTAFLDFARVTETDMYARAVGYGWKEAGKQTGAVAEEPRGDDLARSCIQSKLGQVMEFCVDVPNGEYEVVFWMGTMGHYRFPSRTWECKAEGETKCGDKVDAKTFRHLYYARYYGVDYTSNDKGLWTKYVEPCFSQRTFSVKVNDGQLNVAWKSEALGCNSDNWCPSCPLNGMMVYAKDNKGQAETELKRITRSRQRGYDAFWTENKKDGIAGFASAALPSREPYAATAQDKARGYVLFVRNYMDLVFPDTVPAREEVGGDLKMFATPGEYETVALGIQPLEDLQDVEIKVSELKSKAGDAIPPDQVNVEQVIYNAWASWRTADYVIMPEYTMHRSKADIPAGTTKQYFLTAKVPAEAKAGLYHGKVTVTAKGRAASEMELKVKVLPFKLAPLDGHSISFQWHFMPFYFLNHYPTPEEDWWPVVEKHLIDQREMGHTAACWLAGWPLTGIEVKDGKASGKWQSSSVTEELTDKYFKLVSKVMPRGNIVIALYGTLYNAKDVVAIGPYKYPSEEWKIAVRYLFDSFKQMAAKYELQPLFLLAGEVSNSGLPGIRRTEELFKFARTIPDVKLADMANGPQEVKVLAPYCDVMGVNYPVLDEANINYIKNNAKTFFLYQGHNRFDYGFYYWRIGARGDVVEFYNSIYGDPFNNLDSAGCENSDYSGTDVSKVGPDGEPVHLLRYYFCREGADDARYLNTLEGLIGKAKASGDPKKVEKAQAAQKVLDEIMANINIDFSWYGTTGSWWKSADFETTRWKIAQEIMNLQD